MKVVRLYSDDFSKVDEFLTVNNSSPTHWQEWNTVVSKIYGTDFFYFVCLENEKIIGICPVHKKKFKMTNRILSGPRQYYLPFGGWIFSEKTNIDFSSIELESNESLEVFSLPLIDEFNVQYSGGKILKKFETSIVKLNENEDNIFNGFTPQRRYRIRKAIRNDIEILSIDEFGFDDYYKFYNSTNKRYGLEEVSKDYFNEMMKESKKINLDFFIARKDSNILGAVVLVSDKFYSLYWLGTRVEKAPNTGYFDLLHWEMIKKAKSRGCKYYDLCYLEKENLPNIYRFKAGFLGEETPVLNISKKTISYKVLNKIQKIF